MRRLKERFRAPAAALPGVARSRDLRRIQLAYMGSEVGSWIAMIGMSLLSFDAGGLDWLRRRLRAADAPADGGGALHGRPRRPAAAQPGDDRRDLVARRAGGRVGRRRRARLVRLGDLCRPELRLGREHGLQAGAGGAAAVAGADPGRAHGVERGVVDDRERHVVRRPRIGGVLVAATSPARRSCVDDGDVPAGRHLWCWGVHEPTEGSRRRPEADGADPHASGSSRSSTAGSADARRPTVASASSWGSSARR